MAKKPPEAVTEKKSILYEIARLLGIFTFHCLMPVKCHNKEGLQGEAPFVIIANHLHALDPLAIALFIPKRQIMFLAKKELAPNKFLQNMLTRLHCILVDRHNTDMAAMRNCMKTVKMKKILLIFPEGTRHHEGQMEQIESGAAMIALRSRSPIVPVYLDRKLAFFKRTNIYVGEPVPYDDLLEKGINTETCEEMNERFRETFRAMIREHE